MSDTIKQRFDAILTPATQEEEFEIKAGLLAMQFLSLVDKEMEQHSISKKWLATEIGTSASFITQLFMGDRKPNWNILAKMQKALGLEFKVTTEAELRDYVHTELVDYHKKLMRTRQYEALKGGSGDSQAIMDVSSSNDGYAMAS